MTDIPEDVMAAAYEALNESGESDNSVYPIARANLAERERSIAKIEALKYTEDQGIDQEMASFNDGCDQAIAAIRNGKEAPCCAGGPQWGHAWDCPKIPG